MGQLADKIRAKYPGAYDSMDDAALEKAVVAKYPQYTDLAGPAVPVTTGTISAGPGGATGYLQDVENDFRYGGDRTIVGKALKAMGAPGINVGGQQGAGEVLTSPVLGTIHAAQGVAEKKPLKAVGGVLEAAQLPAAFVAPEGINAASSAAAKVTSAAARRELLSEAVTNTLNRIVTQEGLRPIEAKTASEAVSNLAGQFQARAKTAYQAVDKAVGGELQPVLDKIRDYGRAIKVNRAMDPEKADALLEKRDALIQLKGELTRKAASAGVPDAEKMITTADRDYARYKALQDHVGKQIKTAAGEVRQGGHPNPKLFAGAVDRLNNTGKLERAVGPDAAGELKQVARAALTTEKRVGTAKKVLAGGAAAAGALVGGREAAKALKGEQE